MADTKTEKEPSIEEILESIRQIISDDDPAAKQAETKPAAAAPPPAPAKPEGEPVLELTDRVEEPMKSDLDLSAQAPPPPEKSDLDLSAKTPPPAAKSDLDLSVTEPAMNDTDASLLSDAAANASASAMAKLLAGNVAVESDAPSRIGKVTLEDMAKELMRPLIKTWLDQNLPPLIEKMVQKEIERISHKVLGQ